MSNKPTTPTQKKNSLNNKMPKQAELARRSEVAKTDTIPELMRNITRLTLGNDPVRDKKIKRAWLS